MGIAAHQIAEKVILTFMAFLKSFLKSDPWNLIELGLVVIAMTTPFCGTSTYFFVYTYLALFRRLTSLLFNIDCAGARKWFRMEKLFSYYPLLRPGTDGQNRQTDKTERRTGQTDGQKRQYRQTDRTGQTDGRTDGQTDRQRWGACMHAYTHRHVNVNIYTHYKHIQIYLHILICISHMVVSICDLGGRTFEITMMIDLKDTCYVSGLLSPVPPITLTPYMVLPLFATRFADYAGGIWVSFIQPRLF